MRGSATLLLAFAFLTGAGPSGGRKPVVTVQPPARVVLAPGGWAEARLIVAVADGFHLQANPSSEEYLVPTKLELVASGGLEPGNPIYPPARPYRLQQVAEKGCGSALRRNRLRRLAFCSKRANSRKKS